MPERLQKVMAAAGVASRRASERLIQAGRVTVNGHQVTTLGTKVTPADVITVDGKAIDREKKVYYVFNKPREVITAAKDDRNRRVVTDYFTAVKERVYPVGRLDYDTTGILIMTNDGTLANQLMHPRYGVNKTYVAKVLGVPTNAELERLRHGVRIDDRHPAKARVHVINYDPDQQHAVVSMTIHEGRYHQVKRMLEAVGHPVVKLRRTAYGPLTDQGLAPGQYRPLTHRELQALKKNVQ